MLTQLTINCYLLLTIKCQCGRYPGHVTSHSVKIRLFFKPRISATIKLRKLVYYGLYLPVGIYQFQDVVINVAKLLTD